MCHIYKELTPIVFPPPQFYCFSFSSSSLILLFTLILLLLLNSIVFPPPSHFYCLPSYSIVLLFLHYHHHHISIVFPPPSPPHFHCFITINVSNSFALPHSTGMSRVVNNNRGFLRLLAHCPAYQRQFLLKTATPQQLHALVQVLYNILKGHIPISEENERILLPYQDALLNLARSNVPYKTKKRVLVQDGSGFIENVLASVISSLELLTL